MGGKEQKANEDDNTPPRFWPASDQYLSRVSTCFVQLASNKRNGIQTTAESSVHNVSRVGHRSRMYGEIHSVYSKRFVCTKTCTIAIDLGSGVRTYSTLFIYFILFWFGCGGSRYAKRVRQQLKYGKRIFI